MTPDSFAPMVLLRSGDRVLLTLTGDPDPGEAESLAEALHAIYPGVQFVVVGGVRHLVVSHDPEDDQ